MSYNNYSPSPGGYQVPRAPYGGHQNPAPGAPIAGYPGGYPGQLQGLPQLGPQGPRQMQPMPQSQHPSGGYPGQVGGYASATPGADPTLASWFRAVDQDNSGEINAAELRMALQNGNWSQFSDEACNLMIKMFDKNNTGTIDLQEFSQLFSFVNQWTDAYQRYDQDKSGTISESELNMALQSMGYRLSPQFIGFLIGKFSSRQRMITLDNFIVINVKLRNLTEAFRGQDREMKGTVTINYEQFLNMALASIL